MSIPRHGLLIMSLAGLGTAVLALAQQPAAPASASDLHSCAAIAPQAERLACYDRLAGRGPAQVTAPPSGGSEASAEAPASSETHTSAGAPTPARARPSSTAPSTAPAPASAGLAVTAPPAEGSKEAFGLYALEHPVAHKSATDSIIAKVVELTYDTSGRETVSLEGGPSWQLDGSDALLASGDSVTIKRAMLGSYILTTPSGRTHRVRRLR